MNIWTRGRGHEYGTGSRYFERKQRWLQKTATLLLFPLLWSNSGAATLAEVSAATANPDGFIQRLNANPRINVPANLLTLAGANALTSQQVVGSGPAPLMHAERSAAQAFTEISAELGDLRTSSDSSTWDAVEQRLSATHEV